MEISDSESDYDVPDEIIEAAAAASLDLLPNKSKTRYNITCDIFEKWCVKKNVKCINENVILAYFAERAKNVKASTLWSQYSMLRTTLLIKKNIDIKFPKVIAFLKKKSVGYRAKKSKVFTRDEVNTFLHEANDNTFLMMKVALIVGLAGACRREELCRLTLDNIIEETDTIVVIKISDTKTHIERSFVVVGEHNISLYKKYVALRPFNTYHRRLFIFYKNGKCTIQPVGLHTFGSIPKKIATFLNLPNPEAYTGHCLRRSSATFLVDAGGDITNLKRHGGWKSTSVAEGYIENSLKSKLDIAHKIQGVTNNDENPPSTVPETSQNSANNSTVIQNHENSVIKIPNYPVNIYNASNCTMTFNINVTK